MTEPAAQPEDLTAAWTPEPKEPQPLSDVDLITWAAVLGYRKQQAQRGITILQLPFPPCPTCGGEVHGYIESTVERGLGRTTALTLNPCNHVHTATDDSLYRVHGHVGDILEAMEQADSSPFPDDKAWTTEDVMRNARGCVAPPQPADAPRSAVQAADGPAEPRDAHDGAQAAQRGSDPRQPAYDAVYAYIRSSNRVPGDVVTRNAIIWRAVNAALDAVLPAAHDDGPSVAECVKVDRAWDLQKGGE